MTPQSIGLLLAYLVVLLVLAAPLARWVDKVMKGRFAFGGRVEAPLYRLAGVNAEPRWAGCSTRSASCSSTAWVCSRSMRCSGCRPCCRSIRRAWPR